jgi:hypothetical protein
MFELFYHLNLKLAMARPNNSFLKWVVPVLERTHENKSLNNVYFNHSNILVQLFSLQAWLS